MAPADVGMTLRFVDLGDLADANERQMRLQQRLADEAAEPFDLERGPLARALLLQLAPNEHVLFFTVHHIVFDAWSNGVFATELGALYRACDEDPLPPLHIQYADYAQWQRERIDDARQQHAADYWKQALAGLPPALELPTDRPRPPQRRYDGAHCPVVIDAELTRQLHALSRRHDATLQMTLLASWAMLLARLSGQHDIVIGSPTAGRQRSETEPLIGFFVNMLALRFPLTPAHTVADWLRHSRQQALDAQRHAELPFEYVVELVQPSRSLAHAPIFQTTFAWQNAPRGALEFAGLDVSPLEDLGGATAKFDLSLGLREVDGKIAGVLEYATALYDRATVERYVDHWRALVAAMAADDTRALADLPLLTPAQYRQLTVDWNATHVPSPASVCLHRQFEKQADRTPDAIAVVFEERQLTYAELNARANRLARRLVALGVAPDDRIALSAERGIEMIIGVLGILKAGGAYVPLDPHAPPARLAYLLEDSAPVAVIIPSAQRASAIVPTHLPVVSIEEPDGDADLPADNLRAPAPEVTSQHLAYVIYTSGSTGQPKGVMVEHRSVMNLWTGLEQAIYTATGDCTRIAMNAALSFDASVQALTQLLSGRCVVVVPQSVRGDAAELCAFLVRERIDAFDCTPAQLEWLVAEGFFEDRHGHCVKAILVGGEAITHRTWDRLRGVRTPALYNVYGPTECTVDATIGRIGADAQRPHIGRPLANTQIYILDRRGQPAPVGVAGEICIGGAGVARGYLNRPALDAERFVPDPFAGIDGARMYRTGDLGRWLPDGTIEYVGRNDQQVKIRGFRIELGELECVLERHADVLQAVVAVHGDDERRQLVAYPVVRRQAGVEGTDAAALRRHVAAYLPEYMVPAAIVILDALPLTPNGKVDRRALPAPDFAARTPSREPVTPSEHALAALFADTLGMARVGADDNFFELGGHSLLAVQLVSRIRATLNVALPVQALFEAPTVARLAQRMADGGAAPAGSALNIVLPLRPAGTKSPLFCVHAATGLGWSYAALVTHLDREVPIYALQAPFLEPACPLHEDLDALIDAYVEALRTIQPEGPYRLLGWSIGGIIAHRIATQLQSIGEEVEQLVLLDSRPAALAGSPAAPAATDAQRLRRFLDVLGAPALPDDLAAASPLDILARVHARHERLSALPLAQVQRLYAVFTHMMRIWRQPNLGRFDGKIVFVEATATTTAAGEHTVPPRTIWTRHATNVVTHGVDCTHDDLARPVWMNRIARMLNDML
ncbi:amino acid adenylation domain-containing protein [Paraburkholderia sp. NMBU_R16]|uniref:non-ribosomal peptide synthetase n=1 Tax=Paraburkholderia sp. NMBU_R16 TaxID=2698676 RepID=UPI00349FBD3B